MEEEPLRFIRLLSDKGNEHLRAYHLYVSVTFQVKQIFVVGYEVRNAGGQGSGNHIIIVGVTTDFDSGKIAYGAGQAQKQGFVFFNIIVGIGKVLTEMFAV
jgi:hypothetical protein